MLDEEQNETMQKPNAKRRPNYYLKLPNGACGAVYIKDIEAAKKLIMEMTVPVALIKIKR